MLTRVTRMLFIASVLALCAVYAVHVCRNTVMYDATGFPMNHKVHCPRCGAALIRSDDSTPQKVIAHCFTCHRAYDITDALMSGGQF